MQVLLTELTELFTNDYSTMGHYENSIIGAQTPLNIIFQMVSWFNPPFGPVLWILLPITQCEYVLVGVLHTFLFMSPVLYFCP